MAMSEFGHPLRGRDKHGRLLTSGKRTRCTSSRRDREALARWGISILLVEQYLELALRLADRFYILDAGEAVRGGDRDDLSDPSMRQLLSV
jgi:ABC-type branched-subunit amino acid transport system ATPase component